MLLLLLLTKSITNSLSVTILLERKLKKYINIGLKNSANEKCCQMRTVSLGAKWNKRSWILNKNKSKLNRKI